MTVLFSFPQKVVKTILTLTTVLRLRVATVGAQEHLLAADERLLYRVVDVSGAKSALRHWAQFFESADALFFFVDCSSYNVPSRSSVDDEDPETPTGSALMDAQELFKQTVLHPLLQSPSVFLWFNKCMWPVEENTSELNLMTSLVVAVDLLKAKIQSGKYPLSKYCPDYKGSDTSVGAVSGFFVQFSG